MAASLSFFGLAFFEAPGPGAARGAAPLAPMAAALAPMAAPALAITWSPSGQPMPPRDSWLYVFQVDPVTDTWYVRIAGSTLRAIVRPLSWLIGPPGRDPATREQATQTELILSFETPSPSVARGAAPLVPSVAMSPLGLPVPPVSSWVQIYQTDPRTDTWYVRIANSRIVATVRPYGWLFGPDACFLVREQATQTELIVI